jgi:hypothetical protein
MGSLNFFSPKYFYIATSLHGGMSQKEGKFCDFSFHNVVDKDIYWDMTPCLLEISYHAKTSAQTSFHPQSEKPSNSSCNLVTEFLNITEGTAFLVHTVLSVCVKVRQHPCQRARADILTRKMGYRP